MLSLVKLADNSKGKTMKVIGISLVQRVQADELGSEKIELWASRQGFDVVVIKDNDVFCTDFYEDEAVALRRYNALKNAPKSPRKETG